MHTPQPDDACPEPGRRDPVYTNDYLKLYSPNGLWRVEPEPKKKRACPEPGRRGGRRPGAGAPKGNMNAYKHGRRSKRFWMVALMIAAIPELHQFFLHLEQEENREARRKQFETLALAYNLTLKDPELQRTIRKVFVERVNAYLDRIQPSLEKLEDRDFDQIIRGRS